MPNWKRLRTDLEFRRRMQVRSDIIFGVRRFFRDRGFLEAETPIVVAHPGMEPHLDPFETAVTEAGGAVHPAFLITSPEYSLKKLLAGGVERVFDITKTFRNSEPWGSQAGGDGGRHNPEFTMIEWYRAGADYTALMKDTEEMVAAAAADLFGGRLQVTWQGRQIDFKPPWPRLSVAEAFERYAGIDLLRGLDDPEWFAATARSKGIDVNPSDSFDDIFFKIFIRDIELNIGLSEVPAVGGETASLPSHRPVILYDYPASMAALARLKPTDHRLAERFEVYCCGLELANAFSELNDATEQRRRLVQEQAQRQALGKPAFALDEQFLEAVGMMPDAAGIAFGLDRLVMLLTDSRDIRDVLFFPAEDLFSA